MYFTKTIFKKVAKKGAYDANIDLIVLNNKVEQDLDSVLFYIASPNNRLISASGNQLYNILQFNDEIIIIAQVLNTKYNAYSMKTHFSYVSNYIDNKLPDILNSINPNIKYTLKENTIPITLDELYMYNITTFKDSFESRYVLSKLNDLTNSVYYLDARNICWVVPIISSYRNKIAREDRFGEYEWLALNGTPYREELDNIDMITTVDDHCRHNKVYKVLARSQNHIAEVVEPLIYKMYNKHMLKTQWYHILDMHSIISFENFNYDKINNIFRTLSVGGTIVIWIDIPNVLYDGIEASQDPESQEYHKVDNRYEEDGEDDNDEPREDNRDEVRERENLLKRKLSRYQEMISKYSISRELITNDTKATDFSFAVEQMKNLLAMKEYNINNLPRELSVIIQLITECYKYTNIILCYSDTIAASKNEFFDFIIPKLTKEGAGIINLIDKDLFSNKDAMSIFIENTILYYYKDLNRKDIVKAVIDKVFERLDSGIEDDSTFHYLSSVPMFVYFICRMVEDCLTDTNNNTDMDDKFDKEMSDSIRKAMEKAQEAEKKKKFSRTIMDQTYKHDEDIEDDYNDDWSSSIYSDSRNENKYEKKSSGVNGTDVNSLDEMIGLDTVKQQIKDFASFMILDDIKRKRELKTTTLSKHMIFTGNPGTAKTTVAMLLGHILYENHTIARDNVLIVGRDQLVGKYVGWTAKNVEKYIKEAKGGILFVDEAYSLVDGYHNSYGKEAIDTFVRYMDDKSIRETTIIIFAGYKKEMLDFCETNPGIRSRIGFIIDFPDYSTDELVDIAKLQAKNKGLILSKGYIEELRKSIEVFKKEKSFGNGRFVRSVLEKSMMKQAHRLCDKYKDDIVNISDNMLMTLRKEDFSIFGIKKQSESKSIGFNI